MSLDQTITKLTSPRFVAVLKEGTPLAVWYDNIEKRYVAVCRKCSETVSYESLNALYRELVTSDSKCCQGCRASTTFERNPSLIGLFLDFWCRRRVFPESSSWMEAVPPHPFGLRPKELEAAFEADEICL